MEARQLPSFDVDLLGPAASTTRMTASGATRHRDFHAGLPAHTLNGWRLFISWSMRRKRPGYKSGAYAIPNENRLLLLGRRPLPNSQGSR
jgi:hypothetical protein